MRNDWRCAFETKTMNRMNGQCEESVSCKRYACKVRKNVYAVCELNEEKL